MEIPLVAIRSFIKKQAIEMLGRQFSPAARCHVLLQSQKASGPNGFSLASYNALGYTKDDFLKVFKDFENRKIEVGINSTILLLF